MRQLILSILIDCRIDQVFDYLIDPSHSPEWILDFKEESASPWPPRVGTVYEHVARDGRRSEYRVESFKPPRHFGLAAELSSYHVEYMLSAPTATTTKLVYHEWVADGELEEPFTIEPLERLRKILEASG
jgi:Polyketide cyclase / dehydrase and lipid transport